SPFSACNVNLANRLFRIHSSRKLLMRSIANSTACFPFCVPATQSSSPSNPPRGIDEASFIRIGGIEQWVTVRGQDRDNAVLLFLHGGPGDVTNPWTFALFAPWEKHFTVVQWDQRGAGRTLKRNGPSIAPTLTVDRIAQDGVELAEYLRKHLGKD